MLSESTVHPQWCGVATPTASNDPPPPRTHRSSSDPSHFSHGMFQQHVVPSGQETSLGSEARLSKRQTQSLRKFVALHSALHDSWSLRVEHGRLSTCCARVEPAPRPSRPESASPPMTTRRWKLRVRSMSCPSGSAKRDRGTLTGLATTVKRIS